MREFNVNNLKIAAPCPMNWDAMTGDDRKRFCNSCEHSVYNISEMTEREVRELIGVSQGRLCGRIYRRADGTVMTKDCPTGLRALRRRTTAIAGAMFSTVLGLFSVSYGQQPNNITDRQIVELQTPLRNEHSPLAGKRVVTGVVYSALGAPAADVEVTIQRVGSDAFANTWRTRTDRNGAYIFDGLAAGTYYLQTTPINETYSPMLTVQVADGEQVTLDTRLVKAEFITGLIALPMPPRPKSSPGKTIITREELDRMPKRNLF